MVGRAFRIRAGRRERGGRDDVGGGGCPQHTLADAAPHADLGQLDQAVRFERVEVVVDLLAGDPDAACEGPGRRGLGELGEQQGPHRIERHRGGGRVLDHFHVAHGGHPALDDFSCQARIWISRRSIRRP